MECREKIDIINDLKNLHQDASASAYVLNRIIVKAHKAEGYNGSPKDYSCNSNEEAKSFFISLATESSLTADQTDIVLASWALLDGYPDDESITFRREHYLEEREEFNSSYIKDAPFRELDGKARKNRVDGLNRLSIYPIINRFFNSQPNLMEYISTACKRHIKDVGGKMVVVLPTPSYKLTCNAYTEKPVDSVESQVDVVKDDRESFLDSESVDIPPQTITKISKRGVKSLVFVVGCIAVVVAVFLFVLLGQEPADQIDISPEINSFNSLDLDLKLNNDIANLQDDAQYRAELQTGAEQGNAEDQFCLGISYQLSKEYDFAERWYLAAAKQNYAPAQSLLCLMYSQTAVKEGDIYEWAVKAADNHDALGYFFLGYCYDKGIVVEPDYSKASAFYQGVIDGKDSGGVALIEPLAQYDEILAKCFSENALAKLYQNGDGVEQNYAEALRLFKAAYDDGYAPAALHIGEFYYFGYGIKQDRDTAYLWFLKAAEDGNPDAIAIVDLLKDR